MAPESDPNILTKEEVKEYERRLALISSTDVKKDYLVFWRACELRDDYLPSPGIIQRLLAAWKVLWRQDQLEKHLRQRQTKSKNVPGIPPGQYETPE